MGILDILLWVVVGITFLYLVLVVRGPSIWDRLLGLNLIAAKSMVIIVIFATINRLSYLLDFALIYALTGFIGTIFVTIFLAERQKKLAKDNKVDLLRGGFKRRKGDR